MSNKSTMLAAALLALAVSAGAETKTYQVTGPVMDVTPDSITVQKNKESWTISRGADTKVTGDVKKGDKVTVVYSMTASSIESKAGAKPAEKPKAGKAAADKPAGDKASAAKPAAKTDKAPAAH